MDILRSIFSFSSQIVTLAGRQVTYQTLFNVHLLSNEITIMPNFQI